MPKPTTKAQLLSEAEQERDKLLDLIRPLTADQKTQPIAGEWSVKDILAHLIAWNQMMFDWIEAGKRGETPAVPAKGFNWGQLPALNQHIYEQHRESPLAEIEAEFVAVDRQARALIESYDEADIFKPALYPWMNKNALVAYFHANLGGHYTWAIKEIKRGIKALK